MAKLEDLKQMLESMIDKNSGRFYEDSYSSNMSDTENWICVHATKYKPKRNKDGLLYINATGPATGYKYPRATVHFTLNQIVHSHMGGNWDATPFVILAPYNGIKEKNGNPREVATEDTFFIPNPDTGLVLPESTHIVRPNNNMLFSIGEKVSTYKTDNFTNEEIETILPYMHPWDREEYEKYEKCDFTEVEINTILWDHYTRKIYERRKDKRAFLHGLLSENRITLLTQFLREVVVRKAMEKMGYKYVFSHEDEISGLVAKVARDNGISGDSGNKGHSGSLEHDLEVIGCTYQGFIEILQKQNIGDVYNSLVDCRRDAERFLRGGELNMYQKYEKCFSDMIERIRFYTNSELEYAKEYPDDEYYAKRAKQAPENFAYADRLEQGGISAYNPNLDIVLYRNARRLESEYAKAMAKLQQNKLYPLVKHMVKDFVIKGVKWHKTPNGWQPETKLAQKSFGEMVR